MMPVSPIPAGGKAAPAIILVVLGVLAVSMLVNKNKPAAQPQQQR